MQLSAVLIRVYLVLHKFTSYFLILALSFPTTLFYSPQQANAFIIPVLQVAATKGIPFVGRQVISMGARLGIGKYRNMTQLVLPLKPHRGKLYNAVFKNWTPMKTSATGVNGLALALAVFSLSNRDDSSTTGCKDWHVAFNSGQRVDINNASASSALTQAMQILGYSPAAQALFSSEYLTVFTNNIIDSRGGGVAGGISCLVASTVDSSALTNYIELDLLPNTDAVNEPKLDKLFSDLQDSVNNDPSLTIEDSSTSIEGFSLEEVQSQTYDTLNNDGTTTTHTITKDPTTGELSVDGVLQGDYADVVDAYGVSHRYTVDPVTGNILDNGSPVGNFSTWTDSDGTTHIVTTDPLTGRLMMDGTPWNGNYTVSDPSTTTPPTTIIDPYTGLITQTGQSIDLQPLLDAQSTAILEQKKTTDEIIKTNKSLSDLYSSTNQSNKKLDIINQSLKDLYSVTSQSSSANTVDTSLNAEIRPMSVSGLTGTAQTIIDSSPLNTWVNALKIVPNATASLPVFTVNLLSMGSFTLDFNDFAYFFDGMGVVLIVIATFFAIRIVFRT